PVSRPRNAVSRRTTHLPHRPGARAAKASREKSAASRKIPSLLPRRVARVGRACRRKSAASLRTAAWPQKPAAKEAKTAPGDDRSPGSGENSQIQEAAFASSETQSAQAW